MRVSSLILFFLLIFNAAFSQNKEKTGDNILKAKVIDGDTILISEIPEIFVYPGYNFKNRRDELRFNRLVKNVKAAYPYAKIAGIKLAELDRQLSKISDEKKRKEIIKITEKKIRSEFEEDVKKLTVTQGRLLIKLIDRETGNTTYQVLQNIKGNVSAIFWQAIARIFGSNLKSEYDPYGEDQIIEIIIMMIESGQL